MIECPYEWESGTTLMTNYDHTIDKELAARLLTEEVAMSYAGWNFHGVVWWDRERQLYHCRVSVYCAERLVVSAPTLEQIMEDVSAQFGED